jgi:hypothetical protein
VFDWVGDGICDDGQFGLVFNCEAWDFDDGDCGSESSDLNDTLPLEEIIHYSSKMDFSQNLSRDYEMIDTTSETEYLDFDVINGTQYCYYVTAENDIGESGISNIVCATPEGDHPAPDVILSFGDDIEINEGESGSLDLLMENEDAVAGFQFSLLSSQDVFEIVNVITTDRTEGFTVSWANNTIVGFSLAGDVIEPGTGAYLVVELVGVEVGSAEICYGDVVLAASNADSLPSSTFCGFVTVNAGDVHGCMDSNKTTESRRW